MPPMVISPSHLSQKPKFPPTNLLIRIPRNNESTQTGPIDLQGCATWIRNIALNLEPNLHDKYYNGTKIILCTSLTVSNQEVFDLSGETPRNPVIDLMESGPTIKE
jgi:hypothetical protein